MKSNFFLVALLSTGLFTSMNAQELRPEQGPTPIYQQVDANLIKVTQPCGNYFHVTPEGRLEGAFLMNQNIDDATIVSVQGTMFNGKYLGRVMYRLNGELALIRVYDEEGALVKTTRMHDVAWAQANSLAQN